MNRLKTLFEHYAGCPPQTCEPIAYNSGSNRQYFRLTAADGQSVIGVIGTNIYENNAFIYLSKQFIARHLPVPRVLAEDATGLCYLQTDLGNRSLYDALKNGREAGGHYSDEERTLLHRTIALLPTFQIVGGSGVDFHRCYPQAEMDRTNVLFDLNYFKYCFLKTSDVDFHELRLEDDFQTMATDLTADQSPYFMYRDFQARNVMLDEAGSPHFIDFQGGRRGPLHYDVASFLWQASARYPDSLREELIDTYLKALKQYIDVDETHFRQRLQLFVLFRLLQVLGAYGFRGRFERKQYFLDSIPPALSNLRAMLLQPDVCPYPHLRSVLTQLVRTQKDTREVRLGVSREQRESSLSHCRGEVQVSEGQPLSSGSPRCPHRGNSSEEGLRADRYAASPLVVRILSFSYRRGIPTDDSGHGGGYVFDCRAIHNPGKYPEYKDMTGLDQPVIDFLERDGEILTFLDSVYRLADAHVQRYIERGFTSLMFSFGCTGGQHRSVYCAQHLAEHLNSRFGIEVHITHTARGIHTVLPSTAPRTAMVFAAGLGTRLRPLTDTMPKALVPVAGRPLIEHVVDKLRASGFGRIIVNTHHLADQLVDWAQGQTDIILSDERSVSPEPLDTGGGIRHAASIFGQTDRVLIHNVDILSNADLPALWAASQGADTTLLVSDRPTSRRLLFNDGMRLVGWTNTATGEIKTPHADLDLSTCRQLAFAGIYVLSSALLPEMQAYPTKAMQAQGNASSITECRKEAKSTSACCPTVKFSIIDFYLSLCDRRVIRGHVQPDLHLLDVGKPDTLSQAPAFLSQINA